MLNKRIIIITIILGIILISGCTSETNTNDTSDIKITSNELQPNGPSGEYVVSYSFISKNNNDYNNVTFKISLLDKNNKTLRTVNYTADNPFSGNGESAPIVVIKEVTGTPKTANITVLSVN